jgi:hypothetical protein
MIRKEKLAKGFLVPLQKKLAANRRHILNPTDVAFHLCCNILLIFRICFAFSILQLRTTIQSNGSATFIHNKSGCFVAIVAANQMKIIRSTLYKNGIKKN